MKQTIFFITILFFTSCIDVNNPLVESNMNSIYTKVANDAVDQYYIAKRSGDKMQTYVQAGMVCAAFLQAKDEENYKKWKEIEKEDAEAAGIKIQF